MFRGVVGVALEFLEFGRRVDGRVRCIFLYGAGRYLNLRTFGERLCCLRRRIIGF